MRTLFFFKALQISLLAILLLVAVGVPGRAQNIVDAGTELPVNIKYALTDTEVKSQLHFPLSVQRFYASRNDAVAWLTDKQSRNAWDALMLLDCVKQYGLAPQDYHANELLYEQLQLMLDSPKATSAAKKARFEMMLTDAMLTFANYVHFGKLNPDVTPAMVDEQEQGSFSALNVLKNAITAKNFTQAMLTAQPTDETYRHLQEQLRLITGQYTGDCYEIPDATVRQITINMERLRWQNIGSAQEYIRVNIPSFKLTYNTPDTIYYFKTVVGKPATPTPQLVSRITHFTTAPDWHVPASIFVRELLPKALKDTGYINRNQYTLYNSKQQYIEATPAALKLIAKNPKGYFARQSAGCDNALGLLIFRFQNEYSIYLHDTPQQSFFSRTDRALSHGCIRVQYPDKLAALLLKSQGDVARVEQLKTALKNEQTLTFNLKKSVKFIVSYLTCEVVEGELASYTDIYHLDRSLEAAFYNVTDTVALR